MTKTVLGTVSGRTITLAEDIAIAQGQQVEVTINLVPAKKPWGEGLHRCAGALAGEWTDQDDRILEGIHRERQRDSRREIAE